MPLAEATLAANSCGLAWHFLECFVEIFERRQGHLPAAAIEEVKSLLAQGRSGFLRAREEFYTALDRSWEMHGAFDAVSTASKALVATIQQLVDRLYPFGGLGAAHVESEINRVWRDLHTASQHPLLAFAI